MHSDEADWVYFVRLRELMPGYALNVTGPEVEAVRDLRCAVPEGTHHSQDSDCVVASSADAERWRAATE
ncbi:MAG TPA: hypothetical protein VFY14_08370, partial [Streptomyces sp.]|nr:hypothetical protein [Streptomyces sp.]